MYIITCYILFKNIIEFKFSYLRYVLNILNIKHDYETFKKKLH